MAANIKFRTVDVGTRKVDVFVRDDGWFTAQVGDHTYLERDFGALWDKLSRAKRRARTKISIPFVQVHGFSTGAGHAYKIQRGVCTGIHATTGKLLVRWDGAEQTEQVEFWGGTQTLGDLTTDAMAELAKLADEYARADHAITDFCRARNFDLKKLAEVQVSEADAEREDKDEGSK